MPYTPTQFQTRPRRRGGCFNRALLLGAFLLGFLAMTCSATLLIYVIAPPPPLAIVVMGLDSRGAEGMVARSDSIMLVGVQPRGLDLSLLSIPRDTFIRVPGYNDLQRINTINVLGEVQNPGGGPALVKASLSLSFGIPVTHYIRFNFEAFRAMIDAVGGVTIDVPTPIVDTAYPTDDFGTMTVRFEAGRQHMDGERALIYARTRHADDDYRRAERQQQVLTAFVRRALVPVFWPGIAHALIRHTDTDLSPVQLIQMMPVVLANLGGFERLVVDRDYNLPGPGGPVPDYDKLAPWIAERFR
ncbi:MAG: LCP family protein [Chloroflexota bacterium]